MDTIDADLLDTFKAAALSVTRLYKTSAAAATKARSDGYQECIEDLLAFVEKHRLASAPPGVAVKQWALTRHDGREPPVHAPDSDDDVDKAPDPPSSPVMGRASLAVDSPLLRRQSTDVAMQQTDSTTTTSIPRPASTSTAPTPSPPPALAPVPTGPPPTVVAPFREVLAVPTRDAFTFQTAIAYPQIHSGGDYPNLANLELSDNQQSGRTAITAQSSPAIYKSRLRASNDNRSRNGRGSHVRSIAGQKRRIDFNELFDLQSIGKDGFPSGGGGGGKRSRHN